eukprot:8628630-Alexandrium_andersonii.AAC.1
MRCSVIATGTLSAKAMSSAASSSVGSRPTCSSSEDDSPPVRINGSGTSNSSKPTSGGQTCLTLDA